MRWLADRKVSPLQLCVDPNSIDEQVLGQCHAVEVPGVQTMVFTRSLIYSGNGMEEASFAPFIACFPDLQAISCEHWRYIRDHHLVSLRPRRPLRSLLLKGCSRISADAVLDLILSPDALEELSCDGLEDVDALVIAGACHRLRTIRIAIDLFDHADSIQQLCLSNAAQLSTLSLIDDDDRGDAMGEEVIIAIAAACTRLEHVEVNDHFPDRFCSDRLLNHVIEVCPSIRTVVVGDAAYAFNRCSSTGTVISCDVRYNPAEDCDIRGDAIDDMRAALAALSVPIRAFSCDRCSFRRYLEVWFHACGAGLEELACAEWVSLNDNLLISIASRCPNLVKLTLENCSRISDLALTMLASCCAAITCIRLTNGNDQLTDAGLIAVLEKSKHLSVISVTACRSITDRTVQRLAELSPRLTELRLIDTSVTKEALLEAITARKLVTVLMVCSGGHWLKGELEDAGFRPMPKFLAVFQDR